MDNEYKQGHCKNCSHQLRIPIGECIAKCPNFKCKTINLFLCHVISSDLSNKLRITCQECHQNYTIIKCHQCLGYSGIRDFLNGHTYVCPCGIKATFVICCYCKQMLGLPPDRNYQKTDIRCKKCGKNFAFQLCPACKMDSYKPVASQFEQFTPCANDKCPSRNGIFAQLSELDQESNQQMTNRFTAVFEKSKNKQDSYENQDKDLCKVCFVNENNMINTACYHMAVCSDCAVSIAKKNGECPICRAKGEFKHVYK